jgi:tagatose 6-phosphate kinase
MHAAAIAAALGASVLVVCPLGGRRGARVRALAAEAGIALDVVEIAEETRGTYTVVDDQSGALIEVLEPAPALTAFEARAFEARALARVHAPVVITSGSLPAGFDCGFHASIAQAASGVCLVDASGRALADALVAPGALVTPNVDEAAEAAGIPPREWSPDELARLLRPPSWISLGAGGSLFSPSADESWHLALEPPGAAVNSVGCGDALVGGYAAGIAEGLAPVDAAALGVAAAASKLTHLHPAMIDAAQTRALAAAVTRKRIA